MPSPAPRFLLLQYPASEHPRGPRHGETKTLPESSPEPAHAPVDDPQAAPAGSMNPPSSRYSATFPPGWRQSRSDAQGCAPTASIPAPGAAMPQPHGMYSQRLQPSASKIFPGERPDPPQPTSDRSSSDKPCATL